MFSHCYFICYNGEIFATSSHHNVLNAAYKQIKAALCYLAVQFREVNIVSLLQVFHFRFVGIVFRALFKSTSIALKTYNYNDILCVSWNSKNQHKCFCVHFFPSITQFSFSLPVLIHQFHHNNLLLALVRGFEYLILFSLWFSFWSSFSIETYQRTDGWKDGWLIRISKQSNRTLYLNKTLTFPRITKIKSH